MGKYIKLFDNQESYDSFKNSSNYVEPNISFVKDTGSLINNRLQIIGGEDKPSGGVPNLLYIKKSPNHLLIDLDNFEILASDGSETVIAKIHKDSRHIQVSNGSYIYFMPMGNFRGTWTDSSSTNTDYSFDKGIIQQIGEWYSYGCSASIYDDKGQSYASIQYTGSL